MFMKIKRSQFVRRFSLGIAATLLVSACSPSTSGGDATSDTATGDSADKIIKVGTEPAFAPFEFQGDGGEIEGFDIDLFNAIGEATGYEIRFESLPFDGLIPALQANNIDAAISGMTITAARSQTVDFSQPYFKAGLAIAIAEDNNEVKSLDDLAGKRIAVAIGTTGAATAADIDGAKVTTFDNAPLALQDLANGNADAVINDAPVTLYALTEGGVQGLKVIDQLLTEEFYGIATPKGSDKLAVINEGLTTIIENGTYAEIYQEWFGVEPPELPAEYEPPAD
ncbi:MAG: basic amino acid ABC transporter substrate-binding protein [Leptolyngbyaceae bacterium]|nr:basic amino acid ABC transporter substrate-binding protein [Leptolyngbyaceae bacterium]